MNYGYVVVGFNDFGCEWFKFCGDTIFCDVLLCEYWTQIAWKWDGGSGPVAHPSAYAFPEFVGAMQVDSATLH